jgi:hypothetical protein
LAVVPLPTARQVITHSSHQGTVVLATTFRFIGAAVRDDDRPEPHVERQVPGPVTMFEIRPVATMRMRGRPRRSSPGA